MHDKVSRIRALLDEAVKRKDALARSPEAEARLAYQAYASNDERAFYADPAPRARSVREILRIAAFYNWPRVVERALDDAGVRSLTSLSDGDLEALLAHMRQLEDCARNALDPPDAPPAR